MVSASRVWRGRVESESVRERARGQRACARARETQCRGGMEATVKMMMTMKKMMKMPRTKNVEPRLVRLKPMRRPEQYREICSIVQIILAVKQKYEF